MALLTVLCIAPRAAEAGCYHRILTRTEGPDHFLLLREAGAMDAGQETDTLPPSPLRPGGCSGPSCSENPSEVPATPVLMTVPRANHWAVIDITPVSTAPAASPAHHDDRDTRPVLAAESIFHPPRPKARP